jgi:hypothetical protein
MKQYAPSKSNSLVNAVNCPTIEALFFLKYPGNESSTRIPPAKNVMLCGMQSPSIIGATFFFVVKSISSTTPSKISRFQFPVYENIETYRLAPTTKQSLQ